MAEGKGAFQITRGKCAATTNIRNQSLSKFWDMLSAGDKVQATEGGTEGYDTGTSLKCLVTQDDMSLMEALPRTARRMLGAT